MRVVVAGAGLRVEGSTRKSGRARRGAGERRNVCEECARWWWVQCEMLESARGVVRLGTRQWVSIVYVGVFGCLGDSRNNTKTNHGNVCFTSLSTDGANGLSPAANYSQARHFSSTMRQGAISTWLLALFQRAHHARSWGTWLLGQQRRFGGVHRQLRGSQQQREQHCVLRRSIE